MLAGLSASRAAPAGRARPTWRSSRASATPEPCWFGMTCRNKNTLPAHARRPAGAPAQLRGDNQQCPLGHPLRAACGGPGPQRQIPGRHDNGQAARRALRVQQVRPAQRPLPQRVPRGGGDKWRRQRDRASNCPNTQGQFNGGGCVPPPRDGAARGMGRGGGGGRRHGRRHGRRRRRFVGRRHGRPVMQPTAAESADDRGRGCPGADWHMRGVAAAAAVAASAEATREAFTRTAGAPRPPPGADATDAAFDWNTELAL